MTERGLPSKTKWLLCPVCKSKTRSPQGFQLKLEMILLAYSLLLKSAKSLEPETLSYSIGYQVMAK